MIVYEVLQRQDGNEYTHTHDRLSDECSFFSTLYVHLHVIYVAKCAL